MITMKICHLDQFLIASYGKIWFGKFIVQTVLILAFSFDLDYLLKFFFCFCIVITPFVANLISLKKRFLKQMAG